MGYSRTRLGRFFISYLILYPFFTEQFIAIFLGEEVDDGEELEAPPTENQLDAFANTYQNFLANIEIFDIAHA